MDSNMPRTFAKPITILVIIAAVVSVLNVIFWHLLQDGTANLLVFGVFCIGYGTWLEIGSRQRRRKNDAGTIGPSRGLAAEPGRPVIVTVEREANRPSAKSTAGRIQPRPRHALTIDLEDYFHTEVASKGVAYADWGRQPSRIEASTHRLLDLLDDSSTRATFFVLGWVAQHYPHVVHEIHDRGHEIGCHSLDHRLVCRMRPGEFFDTTQLAKDLIESIIDEPVSGYRAPCFSITPGHEWAFEALAQLGFTYDSSVHPVHHPTYGNPTAPRTAYAVAHGRLVEFPIATWKLAGRNLPVGGGAYLRLLPYQYIYRGLTAWERNMKTSAMLYLHPWEIDPYQPPIPLSFRSKVRQTWGTSTMEEKLKLLLRQFSFAPVREVHQQLIHELAYQPVRAGFPNAATVEQVAG